ncbi:uncharacterized protein ACA1_087470 [Acanthamoeba castellanii str. Neff]|uniref:Uncharacterized protein n=1 Tax=Acanthamoeba castellanii (strain ATCC 30010 / Neff) TaxID=1257118 RepID=L8GU93_ACACF|nr:uncharacterized protein ACA1_087470 [Acanthamoeba castellanii str. Neff]ELR16565.1 hypothetical protein ACA1_087470 [Acanthamoeba castellanii str. Neff]
MEPWQHQRQQVGLGWGDGAPLTARQGAVVARLFALHGEHYGPSPSGGFINPMMAQDEGARSKESFCAAGEPHGALLDDEEEEDDAGERVQGELYAWLDHHPNPEQAQACGMALTDLMDGRGWCADLDRELDQVFETLTELERRCAVLKRSGEAVDDALRHSIGVQLQLEEDAMKSPGRISAFGAKLLAIDKEQVLPLPLPTDLRQREAREQEERAASATARDLLERMNARVSSSSPSPTDENQQPPPHDAGEASSSSSASAKPRNDRQAAQGHHQQDGAECVIA